MHSYYSLILISSILNLTVILSQDAKGPGISSCIFFGERTEDYCGLSKVLIKDIPEKCTCVIYFGVYMDLKYNATNSDNTNDFALLDDMLNSGKCVMIYYSHTPQEWATVLASNSSNEKNNSFDEMEALQTFFDEHPKIAGVILIGLQYNSKYDEILELSEKLKKYLELMEKTYPELAIGIDFRGQFLIDHYANPIIKWLNINDIDCAVDFYVVSLEFFNPCYADLRNTGTVPIKGKANYTLDKLKGVLQKASFPNKKIYFKFKTNPISINDNLTICDLNNEKMCEEPQEACDWCADTTVSYNEKGKFSADNGAGFMVRYIDYDDPDSSCRCATPYPAFNAILDGFNKIETQNCNLLNRN